MAHQGKRMISEDLLAAIKVIKDSGVTAADLIAVAEALKDGDLQGKLTPGDNVTITDENVISATDTTYTAGENITIKNGVISASGGGSIELYENEIIIQTSSSKYFRINFMTKEELTNSNAANVIIAEMRNDANWGITASIIGNGVDWPMPTYNDGTNTFPLMPTGMTNNGANTFLEGWYIDNGVLKTVSTISNGWSVRSVYSKPLH